MNFKRCKDNRQTLHNNLKISSQKLLLNKVEKQFQYQFFQTFNIKGISINHDYSFKYLSSSETIPNAQIYSSGLYQVILSSCEHQHNLLIWTLEAPMHTDRSNGTSTKKDFFCHIAHFFIICIDSNNTNNFYLNFFLFHHLRFLCHMLLFNCAMFI